MSPLQRVTAGDFKHLGNGIFRPEFNHDITIDLKRTMREVEQSLVEQGYTVKALGGFYFQLRQRARLIGQPDGVTGQTDEQEQVPPPAFVLERQLRDWLAHEIEQKNIEVNGVRVKIYNGKNGVEYRTDVGNIDILTVDDNGNFYVFELKLSRGTDSALGQIQRYMGWIKKKIAQNKEVKGVIIAQEIDEDLRCAVSVNPNVMLRKYKLHFTLEKVDGDH